MLKRYRFAIYLLSALVSLLFGTGAPADEPPSAAGKTRPKYIRLERDDDGEPKALETAITRFIPTDGKRGLYVDLIGAVHVGEKSYYDTLNDAFTGYDAVLYELVAPPGTRIPKGARAGGHPVSSLQNGMKNMLGLEHQLEYIVYSKENLVHADMSPDQFSKSMQDRGESFWGMFFRMMGQGISQQAKSQAKGRTSDFDILLALVDRNRAGAMKKVMAEQFENMGGTMAALEGPDGSTIISERNKVALQELTKQIAAGKKRLAIFYGAGHMADIEKRLLADFGLKRDSERWLVAWRIADAAAPPEDSK